MGDGAGSRRWASRRCLRNSFESSYSHGTLCVKSPRVGRLARVNGRKEMWFVTPGRAHDYVGTDRRLRYRGGKANARRHIVCCFLSATRTIEHETWQKCACEFRVVITGGNDAFNVGIHDCAKVQIHVPSQTIGYHFSKIKGYSALLSNSKRGSVLVVVVRQLDSVKSLSPALNFELLVLAVGTAWLTHSS
jgi:hypothetical protein